MERDDLIEYSLHTHHSEEQGIAIRKKIWFVTGLLTALTAVEVFLGSTIHQSDSAWPFIKWAFIIMTLFKAGYIVMVFMHLGDEKKTLRYVVLVPYILFLLYLIFIALWEALSVGEAWSTYGV